EQDPIGYELGWRSVLVELHRRAPALPVIVDVVGAHVDDRQDDVAFGIVVPDGGGLLGTRPSVLGFGADHVVAVLQNLPVGLSCVRALGRGREGQRSERTDQLLAHHPTSIVPPACPWPLHAQSAIAGCETSLFRVPCIRCAASLVAESLVSSPRNWASFDPLG